MILKDIRQNYKKKKISQIEKMTKLEEEPNDLTIKNEKELFELAVSFTLKWEGYKTTDTGGRTVYGISENAHPGMVKKMWKMPAAKALEIAKQIYFKEYWEKLWNFSPFSTLYNNMLNHPHFKAIASSQRTIYINLISGDG